MKIHVLSFAAVVLMFTACNKLARPAGTDTLPPSPAQTQEVFGYICSGTEPFWGVDISGIGIVFKNPESAPVTYPYVAPKSSDSGAVYETEVKVNGVKSKMKITISPGACSDGMSDTEYPFFVEIERDGVTLRGCAREKE